MEIDKRITGKTGLTGVIGYPVGHSISPQLHNTVNKLTGADLVYVPFRVEPGELGRAVSGLKAIGIRGFNVTIPYKQEIIKYIDEISREAALIGAVNTVKNESGRLIGYNTDAEGFVRSFKEETGTGFKNSRVLVIGAGGAARAVALKIALEEADMIHLANRTLSKAMEIARVIRDNTRCRTECSDMEGLSDGGIIREFDIIINTTPVGMYPDIDKMPVDEKLELSDNQIVYDIIYNPPKTRFLLKAEQMGCRVVNGLGMLLNQGLAAYEIWTGRQLDGRVRDMLFTAFVKYFKRQEGFA